MPPDSEEDVSPHVRLRIDPEQKKKWLDFIEDSDSYTTLTDLIKTSVTNTIDNKWMLANEDREESVPNNLSDSIEEIDSRLDAIETALLKSSKSDTNAVLHTWRELFTPRVRFQRTSRRKNFDEKGGLLDLRSRRPRTALATLARMLVLNTSSIFTYGNAAN